MLIGKNDSRIKLAAKNFLLGQNSLFILKRGILLTALRFFIGLDKIIVDYFLQNALISIVLLG